MSETTVEAREAQAEEGILEDEVRERAELTARAAKLPARLETPGLAVTPALDAGDLVARLDVIKDAADRAMQEGVDFGQIPGTQKPTLLKPGAEKLGVLFQLDVQPQTTKRWEPDGHLTVECEAVVYHAPTGARLGKGEGICTTREKKYAVRRRDRTCPSCGESTILKSKRDAEWFCWRKKGGCGETFPLDSPEGEAVAAQESSDVPNPDLPDTWNTIVKMAEKRARVDAVLAVTGASALFTQDVEDGQQPQEAAAAAMPDATAQQMDVLRAALGWMLGPGAKPLEDAVAERFGGTMPGPVAAAVIELVKARKDLDETPLDPAGRGGKKAEGES